MTAGPSGVVNISTVEFGYALIGLTAEITDGGRRTTKLLASVNVVYGTRLDVTSKTKARSVRDS